MRMIRLPRVLALALAALLAGAAAQAPSSAPATDFSEAERLLLMSDQLHTVQPPVTLHYRYQKSGSLEAGFVDQVQLHLSRGADGHCCAAQGEFLSGSRRLDLPALPQAQGNPVILFFLERDIREMQRLTHGSSSYFRKRIRMALYQAAQVRVVHPLWRGKPVTAHEIAIQPYLDDPNHERFEAFTHKQYRFVLSDEVPGAVLTIQSRVDGAAGAPPVLEEDLVLDPARGTARASPTPSVATAGSP